MSISLTKGQAISLEKTSGPKLVQVTMGLGWDVKKSKGFFGLGGGGGSIDLDASCLMFDASNQMVDQVWFQKLQSNDGSIRHSGDNRTGAGDGDDETINVNLEKLPAHVVTLIFTVNSFTGDTFDQVENAYKINWHTINLCNEFSIPTIRKMHGNKVSKNVDPDRATPI